MSLFFVASLMFSGCNEEVNTKVSKSEVKNEELRIVSLDGTITEILAELGFEKNLVGVDVTSTYPPSVNSIQKIGHTRSISIEGIMAMNPTLIIGKKDDTPRSLTDEQVIQIKETEINTLVYEQTYSPEGTMALITSVAKDLEVSDEKIAPILENIQSNLDSINLVDEKPRVLFIYARTGMMMVSGSKTSVNSMIELAGGINAVTEFEGFKPLTTESLIQANPDIILMFDKGVKSLSGIDGVLETTGVLETNAGRNKRIIAMDGLYLTGFGPRLGEAALELSKKLEN